MPAFDVTTVRWQGVERGGGPAPTRNQSQHGHGVLPSAPGGVQDGGDARTARAANPIALPLVPSLTALPACLPACPVRLPSGEPAPEVYDPRRRAEWAQQFAAAAATKAAARRRELAGLQLVKPFYDDGGHQRLFRGIITAYDAKATL